MARSMTSDTESGRKTVLITGGAGSLGFHTAQAILANSDRNVVIAGRTPDKLAAAAERLGDRVTTYRLDLGSLAEVRRAACELPQLHAVVCNAGVHTTSGAKRTHDGIEQTFGVNHLAHFLLVREVLPKMNAPGRVVFVSSGTHDPARRTGFPAPRYATARELAFPGTDTTERPFLVGRRDYTTSKLCNILTAYEFARRVSPDVATFNIFDPGQMPGTGIARDYRGLRAFAWRYVLPILTIVPGGDIRSAKESGAALSRLVLDPALSGVTGRYFSGEQEIRSSAESYDVAKAADLWEASVALTEPKGQHHGAGLRNTGEA
ncbi:SDR family NAD(P)-dependent oxidoreductase [Stackebrandtia soli]|uniref:SDR family NAD(P)-dependent oxidoreductase n=1 Tax=Stackebrandtia soli TaxID=1892856 RepID=UPI0039EA0E8C